MQIRLDPNRLADDYARLAGQVREPWPYPLSTSITTLRTPDGGYITSESHTWRRQDWDRVIENCARQNGKTERLRADMEAWIDEYWRVTGEEPTLVSVPQAAWDDVTGADPLADLETWLDLVRQHDSDYFDRFFKQDVSTERAWLNSWVMGSRFAPAPKGSIISTTTVT